MPLTPTNVPGVFLLPEIGAEIKLSEWEEMDIYDTVALPATTVLAGNVLNFFRNVGNKSGLDTNLETDGKVPGRHEVIVMKPSIFVVPQWGTAQPNLDDQIAIYGEGVYELQKNRKIQITETHLWRLQSGYGIVAYGLNPAGGTATPTSLGVASPAAIPPLLIPFMLAADDTFSATLTFQQSTAGVANNAGLAAPVFASFPIGNDTAIKNFLHSFVKSPGTR